MIQQCQRVKWMVSKLISVVKVQQSLAVKKCHMNLCEVKLNQINICTQRQEIHVCGCTYMLSYISVATSAVLTFTIHRTCSL